MGCKALKPFCVHDESEALCDAGNVTRVSCDWGVGGGKASTPNQEAAGSITFAQSPWIKASAQGKGICCGVLTVFCVACRLGRVQLL